MSHEGKMRRGEAYYNMRDNTGNYPKGITSNENKMEELNYYLENSGLKEAATEDTKKKKGGK